MEGLFTYALICR